MKALVTGSAGFIGRHITAVLEDTGYTVTGIDLANHEDARDYFLSSGARFDVVVHAAAVVGGRATIDGRPLALAVNLELDAALFGWAARTRPGRVVYLSSSAAYPTSLQDRPRQLSELDLDLRCPGMPDQLYGWCKLTGEILAGRARDEGLPVTVVRPFSGYGEDQDEAYPFAAFAARARRHADPFDVWGTGAQVRDFIHVDDICAAILAMINDDIDGPVNLGTGRGTDMLALAHLMAAAAHYQPAYQTHPNKPTGVAYRVAGTSRMEQVRKPRVTLEEGIRRALT